MTILTTSRKRRGGKDNPQRGGPRCGAVSAGRVEPTPQTQFSVYDGTPFERIGSFRHDDNGFVAFTRLGREIGTFATQNEAIVVIEREASR
jgi:hypothetical protein